MKKYIYKITNNINGKVYIGQTNNFKRRIQEHKHDKRNHHPIHDAIKKYGWENFSTEILYYGDCYNGLEKYFIQKYKSNDKRYGYNIQHGGEDSSGENNPAAKLTQKQIDSLIDDLINTDIPYRELCIKYGVNLKYITNVNVGVSWRCDDLYTYPLRRMEVRLSEEEVDEVIRLLKTPNLSITDIENKTGIKRYIILGINNGKTHRQADIQYPIKELGLPAKVRDKIIDLLKSSQLTPQEIANECNVDRGLIYRINSGQYYRREDCTYPLRKISTERNELGQYQVAINPNS